MKRKAKRNKIKRREKRIEKMRITKKETCEGKKKVKNEEKEREG